MWLALTYLLFPRCGDKNPSCLSSSSLFHASPHEAKPIFLLRLLIQFSLLLQSHTPCHPLLKPFCSSVIFFCLSLRSPLCVCLISPQTSNLFRSGQELPAVLSVALQFQHMKTSLSLSLSHWSTKRRRFIWGSTGLKKKLHNFKWGNTGKLSPLYDKPPFLCSLPLWILWKHTVYKLYLQLVAQFSSKSFKQLYTEAT